MLTLDHLISHRFRGFAPLENTIEGLTNALDFGVRIVEFDVRMAKCGTPIVYHDEHAKSARGKRKLSDIMARDYDEAGGRFPTMPTLDDLLASAAAHPNKARLLIDIKDAGFAEAIRALIHLHRLTDRVVYVSWLPEVLYAVHALEPTAPLCLSHWAARPDPISRAMHHVFVSEDGHVPCPDPTPLGERSGWWLQKPLTGELLDMISKTGGYVCIPAAHVTDDLIAYYREHGISLTAFSYLTDATARAAYARGVDPLFIDKKKVFDAL